MESRQIVLTWWAHRRLNCENAGQGRRLSLAVVKTSRQRPPATGFQHGARLVEPELHDSWHWLLGGQLRRQLRGDLSQPRVIADCGSRLLAGVHDGGMVPI